VNSEVLGLFGELAAAHPKGQVCIRKFKAILLGPPGLAQFLLEVTDARRGAERRVNWRDLAWARAL